MNIIYALFPAAALAALVVMVRRVQTQLADEGCPIRTSEMLWAAPSILMLVATFAFAVTGFTAGSFTALASPVCCAIMAASAFCSLTRRHLWKLFDEKDAKTQKKIRIGLIVCISVLALLTTEVPYNSKLPFFGPSYFWLEMILEGLLLFALYLIGMGHAGLMVAGGAFFFVAGTAQHFVRRFKNSAILPTDLLVLDTAAAVGGEYVFSLIEQTLAGMACFCLFVCAVSLLRPPQERPQPAKVSPFDNFYRSVVCLVSLVLLVFIPSYQDLFGMQMKYWYSIDYYQMQGFFPSFIMVSQDMPIKKPKGYTTDEATETLERHASAFEEKAATDTSRQAATEQFKDIRPTVMVIMNESFSDLSVLDGMHAGYEGPEFFKHGLTDALMQGPLNVTVHGAGTCNTEFEFLTSNSLSFIGVGKYPYSIYDLEGTDAIPAQFKDMGYQTLAIHPNFPSNWKRDQVYPNLGFDTFLSIDDFGGVYDLTVDKVTPNEPHAELFHSGVSDKETYDRMLDILSTDERPYFFFDVTMANHGSYDQNNIPEEYRLNYRPTDFVGEETPERLNEFLSCIKRSDDDLKYLISRLREMERPVVVVFFGDHQPVVSAEYNDYWYPGEPEDVHARRIYQTNYVVWANYDVAGATKRHDLETSVDLLASQFMDTIGADLTDFEEAQLDISASIPALSALGYKGADGTWYDPKDESAYANDYRDLSLIEYLHFADKHFAKTKDTSVDAAG